MEASSIFVVVLEVDGSYNSKNTHMEIHKTQKQALDLIGNLYPEQTLRRVFEVDEKGKVKHYSVVFNGRLALERTPEEAPRT